jgi:serine/threonine protein kinase
MRDLPLQPLSAYGKKQKELGKGSYGRVEQYSGGYAVKFFSRDWDGGVPQDALTEIAIMTKLCCQCNIAGIIDAGYINSGKKKSEVYMVMPLAKGNLDDYEFDSKEKLIIAYQLIKAIADLHRSNIVHLDIKSDNVLILDDPKPNGCEIILSDYGLASMGPSVCNRESAYIYPCRAPEVFFGDNFGYPADVWATAVTIFELFTGEECFGYEDAQEDDMIEVMTRIFGDINEITWPGVTQLPEYDDYKRADSPKKEFVMYKKKLGSSMYDLLTKMLQLDPSKRITAHQALYHPAFDGIRGNIPEPIQGITFYPKITKIIGRDARESVIDELFGILDKCKLEPSTFVHGCYLGDLLPKSDPGHYAVALSIASKVRDDYAISIYDMYNFFFKTSGEPKDALDIELEITKALRFNIHVETPLDLIMRYAEYYDERVEILSQLLLILLLHVDYASGKSHTDLALLCIYVSCKLYKVPFKHESLLNGPVDTGIIKKLIIEAKYFRIVGKITAFCKATPEVIASRIELK